MKKIKSLLIASSALMLLGACSSDKDSSDGFDFSHKSSVTFTTTIGGLESRAIDSKWTAGDAIGVYAVKSGMALEDGSIYDDKKNIKHTTSAGPDGKFIAAKATEAIQLKGDQAIDIVAYYPYNQVVTDYVYNINVSDQSDSEKIDLLYANNVKGLKSPGTTVLNFSHQLSQLVLNVETGSGVTSLQGLTVNSLKGFKAEGVFNLADAELNIKDDATAVVLNPKAVVQSGNKTATVKAILIPGQGLKSAEFELLLNGQLFTWSPQADLILESGKKYTYNIQLSQDGVITLNPGSTIEDWEEGNDDTGTEVIKPEEEAEDDEFFVETYVQFGTSGDTKQLAVKAGSKVEWTVSTTDNWLTVTPAKGKGSGSVSITAPANSDKKDRTGTIIFNALGKATTVTVFQAYQDRPVGEEIVVMHETFGENEGKFDVKFGDFDGYAGFSTKNVVFSNKGSRTDIRARATIMNAEKLAWMPSYNPAFPISPEAPAPTINISEIDTKGLTDIQLSFDLSANFQGKTANANYINVTVDGRKVTVPSGEINADEHSDKYYNVSIAIDAPFSTLEFTTDERNDVGMRLDNIKITGKK